MSTKGGHWLWRSPITAMAMSVYLDVAWLRRGVLGVLEGSGMGGGWDLEYRNCCSDNLSSSIHTGEAI